MSIDPKRLVWQFLREHKWTYLISMLSIVLSNVVMVQFPNLLGQFTNALQAGRLNAANLRYYSGMLLLVGVMYVVLYGIGQFGNGKTGRQFEYSLRQRLFTHWELLSAGYYRQRSIGDLLNHAMTDVRSVRESLSGGLNILTNSIFLLITTLFMTFRTVSVRLTLVAIIPILFVPLFVIWWGPKIRLASRKVQEALSDMADLAEESFAAIRLIKATSNEEVDAGRFEQRVDAIVKRQLAAVRQGALFQSMIPLMGSISFAVALLYGGYMTLDGHIPLGSFVAFTLYLGMLITPLQQIGFVINNFQRASASLARLRVLLSEEPEIKDPEHPVDVTRIRGDIRVNLPEFRYPDGDRPALSDISFRIGQGQTLGIVGKTASGKTTLANLLPRVFDPMPGCVFFDGHDIRSLSLDVLRQAVAYVPQDGFLFSTTISENIAFGKQDCTPEEIEEAARFAHIYDDIRHFKNGFDTLIGERGVALSGGQKQRTAIARAFLKDAPILILDDSLSAVDMNTEKEIISNLAQHRRDQTTVIIAHRLSAVRHADLILVLDNGRIAQRGTHEELLASGGIYAEMYALQEQGEEAAV
ncbi:ABC transporter ATP-binding protein/permease [Alicyclobacillus tolerans]|uniref:ABC transporter ATP-binding protein n=1 Tax=Alicyclobacillus tolerans TaxID=90970 RepID=UPI001F48EA09|nr:ABC transporter ATP-binding protein [Alicyclobacillus tolerans]MCF8567227.1 ABC transporter ATP-binding protein/permease [Alicyclobacillus tolerans]